MEYDRGTGKDAATAQSLPYKSHPKGRKSKGEGSGEGGGRGGGRGGRRGHRKGEGRANGFDPHASIAPKILTKRALAPADAADLSQPSPPPSSILLLPSTSLPPTPTTERTLFIPSSSSSSAPSPSHTTPSPHHKRAVDSPSIARPSPTSTLTRTSSPSLPTSTLSSTSTSTPLSPPPLTFPSPPLKLLTPHFRLSSLDLLSPLLFDHPHFTVVATLGLQGSGKSSLLNALLPRPFPTPFAVAAGGGGGGGVGGVGGGSHTTQGVDIIVTPDHVLFLDTQPLLSPSVVAALQREEGGGAGTAGAGGGAGGGGYTSASAFSAQVAADMFDLQLPLLLLSLSHVLLLTVTWPIPASLLAHLRAVFTLHTQLASTLPPSPHPLPLLLLLLNKAAENSDDSPLTTHSPLSLQLAVDALFADCGVGWGGGGGKGGGRRGGLGKGGEGSVEGGGAEGEGGGGEGGVRLRVCVVPWKERGSLYESSVREMRQVVLGLRREGGAGGGGGAGAGGKGGGGGEKEWGRRVTAVHSALVHSALMREQRKAIERRVALLHPPPPSPSPLAAQQTGGHHGHGGSHAGHGQGRRGGLGAHAAVKEAGDASYHRDAPATSHHKLYTPP